MDSRPEVIDDDEISLYDIYDFLRDGWKTLFGMSVVGVALGVVVSLVMPEKFQASGALESTKVAGTPVEGIRALAEKMRSPTYYSAQTIEACELQDELNPASSLAKALNPNVGRNSTFLSISFEAASPAIARDCLTAVIEDVRRNQGALARASKQRVQEQIRLANQQFERATQLRDQQLALNVQRLEVAREKQASAQRFITAFENRALNFDFKDDQFSASSLLVATLQSKQNEVKDLQIQIDDLEMKVQTQITGVDNEVFEIEDRVLRLVESLDEPATRDAHYATPIYAPDTRVSPRRSLITVLGLLLGGFAGLMLLIGRRVYRSIKEREASKQPA